ncbi:MAG: hypothetical protein AAGI66_07355 [Cyanobacteria bacterium P01_H01_bin.74]
MKTNLTSSQMNSMPWYMTPKGMVEYQLVYQREANRMTVEHAGNLLKLFLKVSLIGIAIFLSGFFLSNALTALQQLLFYINQ